MKSSLMIMAVAAAAFGLSNAASAEIVTATFTGTVNFVFNSDGGLPSASQGDTLVATYVFDLSQATQSSIIPTGGFFSGPYGSFASASVTINGLKGALPTFTTGELTGETQVFDIGSVIDAVVTGGANHLESSIEGTDFAWNLAPPVTSFSYTPTIADQTLIQLGDSNGDLLEADISKATLTVSSGVPEPSTWAIMLLGFAGIGYMARRGSRATTGAVV